MMYSINDIVREKIFSNPPLDFFLYFDALTNKEQEFVFRIILSDYYKIIYNYDKESLKIFNVDVEFLLDFCKDTPEAFVYILNGSKVFYDLDKFSKCLLLESMESIGQDRKLLSISRTHLLDKMTYILYDDIESYKDYYKEYVEKNKNNREAKNKITDYFTFKMMELKYEDEIKYKKNILEFIKVYYKWKIFIKQHEGEYLLNKQDFVYLNIIQNKSVEEILDTIDNDIDFLVTMVEEFFHYSTAKLEIPEKIIDEYFETSSDEVKKKLNL